MISKLWITMPADLASLAPLGEALRGALLELNASDDVAASVELCVTEAVNNAIERSLVERRPNRVEVQVSVEEGMLRIAIGDRGARLPSTVPTLTFDPQDRQSWPEGGMGLFLIHQLMNDIQYKSDPTHNLIQMSCSLKVS